VLQGDNGPSRIDLPLLKAVARARRWAGELISGRAQSVDEIARREGLDRRSVRWLRLLGFLSPRVVEAIVEGHQPAELGVVALTRRIDIPLLWSAQEQALGIH
jgi:site-specific DNA recombinase